MGLKHLHVELILVGVLVLKSDQYGIETGLLPTTDLGRDFALKSDQYGIETDTSAPNFLSNLRYS